ncbi:phosphate signaling complex PhoU family protein [Halomarina pelagica]|uniref:phosphate signaling complex PhoU family protein n=1 Tax=Halomarina pelagica TaxID=2961599 RepID=UPI0020C47B7C|nr:phosphate uptake regulator PhoU [Halomarina sp. BND7]
MERRKVQLTGGSTYTVSLPKHWAETHDIDAGTHLSLHPKTDGSLLVRTNGEIEHRRAVERSIDGREPRALARMIRALYTTGADVATLTATEPISTEERRAVTDATGDLIGLEVVRESDHEVVVRNLLSSDEVSVQQTVVQLQLTVLSMQRKAVDAVARGDRSLAERVAQRDGETGRLFAMLCRQYHRAIDDPSEASTLGVDHGELRGYYATAERLVQVGDCAASMAAVSADEADEADVALPDPLLDAARRARSVVEDATDVVVNGEGVEQAYEALDTSDVVLDELDGDDWRSEAGDAYAAGRFRENVRQTAECGAAIAGLAVRADQYGER